MPADPAHPPAPPARPAPPPEPVRHRRPVRFDGVERIVHWVNAVLFLVLILTGAALYLAPLAAVVGRRALVERIHVYAGVVLPVPVILALGGRWGRALRRDLSRLNRWTADDRAWLRAVFIPEERRGARRAELLTGKFNAGQKLNAAFTAGGGLVMLGTGCLLRWYRPFPLSWRAGATFVHNWLALAFVVVIAGHVLFALSHPTALRSMVAGAPAGRAGAGRRREPHAS
ncbi:MAG: cytochrome b/b6 domain-containing protein [Acidimicrobiales bacterium]